MIVLIDLQCDASLPSGVHDAGGGNKYSRNLISLLLSNNIPFLYFTVKRFAELETEIRISKECYFYRIDMNGSSFNNPDRYEKSKRIIIDYIELNLQKFKTYSFIFHSMYWTSGEIAAHFANQYNTYFVHTVISNGLSKIAQCGSSKKNELRCIIEKRVYLAARYLICSSRSEADDINSLYEISSSKIVVSGRVIEKEYINPYQNIAGDPRTYFVTNNFPTHHISENGHQHLEKISEHWWYRKAYIYVGRIDENKGIIQIIQAWELLYKKLGESTPPLWIVGGSPCEISIFKKKHLNNLQSISIAEQSYKLVWWGTLAPEGISTLMSKSQVLIMHSKYEAGGNVLLEAMAHALPVIATPFGYAKDYIRHSENGYLVEYGNIIDLSKYMEYFYRQPYLSNYMGRIAANDISSLKFREQFNNQHLSVYGLSRFVQPSIPPIKVIPRDSIDTFTQRLIIPDVSYIYFIIKKSTNLNIKDIQIMGNIENYYLWKLITSSGIIYFYYLYSILNWECLEKDDKEYFISSYKRVNLLRHKCEKNSNKIFYYNASEGYIAVAKRERIDV